MSPAVFSHGDLRLYLLALLDESPQHGYGIIQALTDRTGGTYTPSAGTIYPRLAKLEEEGLVTKTVDGRTTVYAITDAGRAELQEREGDLAGIESGLADSVRLIATEVRQSVQDAMKSLRADLAAAAQETRTAAKRGSSSHASGDGRPGGARADDPRSGGRGPDRTPADGDGPLASGQHTNNPGPNGPGSNDSHPEGSPPNGTRPEIAYPTPLRVDDDRAAGADDRAASREELRCADAVLTDFRGRVRTALRTHVTRGGTLPASVVTALESALDAAANEAIRSLPPTP